MALTKINNNSLSAVTTLPAGVGGKVLQVVQGSTSSILNITTQSYVDTGLSASITPSSTSNKVLVLIHFFIEQITAGNTALSVIDRNGTHINQDPYGVYSYAFGDGLTFSHSELDSPNSTSALTYKLQMKNEGSGYTTKFGSNTTAGNGEMTIQLLEIAG